MAKRHQPPRFPVATTYPVGNCGKVNTHLPHIVWDGDHEVYGRIFGRYLCDGGLDREKYDIRQLDPWFSSVTVWGPRRR